MHARPIPDLDALTPRCHQRGDLEVERFDARRAPGLGLWLNRLKKVKKARVVEALKQRDDVADLHQAQHELDATAVQPYVSQVRTSMDRLRNVKTKLTAIDTATGDIRADVDLLRAAVSTALESMESLLRKSADATASVQAA